MKNFIFKKYENDIEIENIIKKELNRQKLNISLIASENYATKNVMKIQSSCLTNKYCEGYPGKRYYEGCKYIDEIEKIAIKRVNKLFKSKYANVQAHSGSQANLAVYNALLKIGDTILSMDISHGGHLSHGSKVNISGKIYNFIFYKTDKYGEIDYYDIYKKTLIYKPKLIIAGSSSYSNVIDWKKIKKISLINKSYFLSDISHVAGLVSAKIYPNPIKYADIVTFTTHKTFGGPRGGVILSNNEEIHKKINSSIFPGIQGGPLMHIIAAKAVSFKEAFSKEYKKYQKNILKNIRYMSKIFLSRNFNLISKNVNSNLFLIDLRNKKITGDNASRVLSKANIIVNKNIIPNEKLKYSISSGIRIGSTSISRRNLNKDSIKKISNWTCDIIENYKNKKLIKNIKKEIIKICKNFPIY